MFWCMLTCISTCPAPPLPLPIPCCDVVTCSPQVIVCTCIDRVSYMEEQHRGLPSFRPWLKHRCVFPSFCIKRTGWMLCSQHAINYYYYLYSTNAHCIYCLIMDRLVCLLPLNAVYHCTAVLHWVTLKHQVWVCSVGTCDCHPLHRIMLL